MQLFSCTRGCVFVQLLVFVRLVLTRLGLARVEERSPIVLCLVSRSAGLSKSDKIRIAFFREMTVLALLPVHPNINRFLGSFVSSIPDAMFAAIPEVFKEYGACACGLPGRVGVPCACVPAFPRAHVPVLATSLGRCFLDAVVSRIVPLPCWGYSSRSEAQLPCAPHTRNPHTHAHAHHLPTHMLVQTVPPQPRPGTRSPAP